MFFDEEMQVKKNRCDEVALDRYSVKKSTDGREKDG